MLTPKGNRITTVDFKTPKERMTGTDSFNSRPSSFSRFSLLLHKIQQNREGFRVINEPKTVDFFLCTNAANRFFSLCAPFDEPKPGYRRFLIKGSAGCGKSTAMKRIAARFARNDSLTERIHCSSDPDSLDGVILHDARCSIMDATPPHAVEPVFPASFQTVCDFWSCLRESVLTPRLPALSQLQQEIGACHEKCRRLLSCTDLLLSDNRRLIAAHTDFKKIDALAARIAAREFSRIKKPGILHRRLLSAVTMQGILTYVDTPTALCERICLIEDPYGISANRLIENLTERALQAGYEVYVCPSPLAPDRMVEHLLIPELSLAFLTRTRYIAWENCAPYRTIRYTRFTDHTILREKKHALSFQRKAAEALLSAAQTHLCEAKRLHDELETLYHDGVDFTMVDRRAAALADAVACRYPVVL